MKRETFFAKLHDSLIRIKHKLAKKQVTLSCKEEWIHEIDHWLAQFEVLSQLPQHDIHIPDATMHGIEALLMLIDEALNEKVGHLETEMHGAQIYSYYEYRQVKNC